MWENSNHRPRGTSVSLRGDDSPFTNTTPHGIRRVGPKIWGGIRPCLLPRIFLSEFLLARLALVADVGPSDPWSHFENCAKQTHINYRKLHGVSTADSVAAFRSSRDTPGSTRATDPFSKSTIDPSPPVWEISNRPQRQHSKRLVSIGAADGPAFYRSGDVETASFLVFWIVF